jgi:WD40-like Beta Propeller Repeat
MRVLCGHVGRARLCALVVAAGWMVAGGASAPALALSRRGHALAFSFASPGAAKGLAVDEASGHVYVSLPSQSCAPPSGPHSHSLGCVDELKVSPGSPVGEAKVVRTLQVADPSSVAVDNAAGSPSHGDVYVSGTTRTAAKAGEEEEDKFVFKFGATGTAPIDKLKRSQIATSKGLKTPRFEPILGLAVDSAGNLLVYEEEGFIARFNNALENESLVAVESGFVGFPTPGLAVDPVGNIYVGHESENPEARGPAGEPAVVGRCQVSELECEPLLGELDQEATTAVATNGADEVFIDNVDEIAGKKVTSVVALSEPSGAVIQRLPAPGVTEGNALAAGSSSGALYATGAGARTVDVFELEPPGPPRVDSLSACVTSQCEPAANAVKLTAAVDPSGSDTQASFEFGTANCSVSACTKLPEAPQDLGGAFGDQTLQAEPPIKDLKAGVTYHFRVFASNEHGQETSPERTFTIPTAQAAPLADGRAWEMVSPPDKDGLEPEPIVGFGAQIQASADGSAITFVADGPLPCEGEAEGSRSPEPAQILSVRGAANWACQDISTANSKGVGANVGLAQEYQAFTPDLSLALLQPFPGPGAASSLAAPALSPRLTFQALNEKGEQQTVSEGPQEKTIYLHDDAAHPPQSADVQEAQNYAAAKANGEVMGNAGFLALVTEANALGVLGGPKQGEAPFGGGFRNGVEIVAATPDLSHVLINSAKARPGLYEWGPAPRLQLVSVVPKAIIASVEENSKIIAATAGESPLSPGLELAGQGIPPETTLVRQVKDDEWEMSAASTSAHAEESITVFTPGHGAIAGGNPDVRHAISDSGARVFWTGEGSHLYVRDVQTREAAQLDVPQSGAEAGTGAAAYQTASADGTKVFFTDSQPLTPDSRAVVQAQKRDLYVAQLSPEGSPLSPKLTDLTPAGIHGESAAVQGFPTGGGVLGASQDGAYVYFVANAALTPDAAAGDCFDISEQAPERSCNLYVRHFDGAQWEPPKLIAVLSNDDSPDWGGGGFPGNLALVTSRVSPNGRYLAFMSERPLTGYDNQDATSSTPGERRDEEVFLYDASTETLVCASCNPSGARPLGVHDPGKQPEAARESEGVGLVVDRPAIWGQLGLTGADHWLAGNVPGWTAISTSGALYQSRYLSDEGRLFFNSPDLLVPAVAQPYEAALKQGNHPVSKEKVYEYEPSGVGKCESANGCIGLLSSPNGEAERGGEHESAFLDASESGDDVFFLTAAKLSTADKDTNFDVYDARVCAQAPSFSCLPGAALGSEPCSGETTCKQGPVTPKQFPPVGMTAPASAKVPAGATLPSKVVAKPKRTTRAQLLAKALKHCRARYKAKSKRKQRVACERRARRRYSAAHKRSKKASQRSPGGSAR